MIDIKELKRWLATLNPEGFVAVDDGGLTLVELNEHLNETGAYLEVGGIPFEEED